MGMFSLVLAGIVLLVGTSALSCTSRQSALPPPVIGSGGPFLDDLKTHDRQRWSISHGWSNGPFMLNDWRRSQTQIDNGMQLTIAPAINGDKAYSSGEVQSRATYGHGYYEATLRAASGSGIVSGIFTYTGPPFGKPWNEIDVEILGKNTREAVLTYHLDGQSRSRIVRLPFDAAAGFNHYAFDWQPGHIRWFINGVQVHEETGGSLPLPNQPQKLMVHLWATDRSREWAGPFDPRAIPAQMQVGCIAYSASRKAGDQCR
ncbi:MAG: family 16 glycosylhydrolase [Erythrobacter sp.]